MVKVVTVLRSGGEYKPSHVVRLKKQVCEHLPGAEFLCLTDMEVPAVVTLPLKFDWYGWWAKMELFRPTLRGDFLYMDLDTTLCGSLEEIAAVKDLTIMRDVYRKDGLQSSLMFIPERARYPVWSEWTEDPLRWIREYKVGGDQAFLERFWKKDAALWQDLLPGQVVSYKQHVRKATSTREHGKGEVPPGARVVIFHGKPRPWDVGW